MIDFLNEIALTSDKLHEEVEFLIDNFIPKGMITIFYSDGGNAKTWTAYGVAAHLIKNGLMDIVYYLDIDNPLPVIKQRCVDKLLIERFPNLKYIHRSELTTTPLELLEELARPERCKNHAYKGMSMLIDSIRNLTDVKNDSKAMYMMDLMMTIRDAGMTFVCIAHSNKDAKNYEGSNNIKNSTDAMFKQRLLKSVMGKYVIVELVDTKERAGTKDCIFKIDTNTLEMTRADPITSKMSPTEDDFIKKIISTLARHKSGIKQGELLTAIGSNSADKTTRAMLDKFANEFYTYEEKGNSKIYKSL
ncbi:MAG: hypothetical protein C0625_08050 [Arcobacter sp.]|nr:MAG: hypothetical protein C0625_08050 [Arcobacter sp.]